ncbi:hypothetical protein LEP1GSC052_0694 [Leptospira kmetyi serovar Malaysia str. Bejo-Iso9]|nr:hypothetical protein LEP1GSC052_0694 [Leptospira kmetyi serovar Malaysia str. Bejo-Iso9]
MNAKASVKGRMVFERFFKTFPARIRILEYSQLFVFAGIGGRVSF